MLIAIPNKLLQNQTAPVVMADGIFVGNAVAAVQLNALFGNQLHTFTNHYRSSGQCLLPRAGIGIVAIINMGQGMEKN